MTFTPSFLEGAEERTILLAEDHEPSRQLLESYLHAQGFGVVATPNGEERGLSSARQARRESLFWTG
jgi:CheY-like chemotaxis protein